MTAPVKFKRDDVKRAASGVLAAGLPIRKVEIDPNGKIIILTGHAKDTADDDDEWQDLT